MKKELKICVIGLGSIGKRHVKNLIKVLGERGIRYEIDALRSRETSLPDEFMEIIRCQYYSAEELPNDYDIVFVTNPTSCHYGTIKEVLAKTKHMFIEKPVFDSLCYDLKSLSLRDEGTYYVACPLRHKSIMKYVKQEILVKENILSARVISSSYLPSWRKGIDYRKTYSSRSDMGGGATRDLIHEWDYILYLFGSPQKVFHIQKHLSNLEIECEDISVYIAEYPKMILEMHLDYIGHKTERILQIFAEGKRIDVDLIADKISEYTDNVLTFERIFQKEDFYINELEYFINCIEKREENINTIADAYNTLRVAIAEE